MPSSSSSENRASSRAEQGRLARLRQVLGHEPSPAERELYDALCSRGAGLSDASLHASSSAEEAADLPWPDLGAGVIALSGKHRLLVATHGEEILAKDASPRSGASLAGVLGKLLAMGARPLAAQSAIRAGEPNDPRNAALLRDVVDGLSGYAREAGLAMVGNDLTLDRAYDGRCLVDVVGIGAATSPPATPDRSPRAGDLLLLLSAPSDETAAERSTSGSPRVWHRLLALRDEIQRQGFAVNPLLAGGGEPLGAALELSRLGLGLDLESSAMRPDRAVWERLLIVADPAARSEIDDLAQIHALSVERVGVVAEHDRVRIVEGDAEKVALPIALLREPSRGGGRDLEEAEEGRDIRLDDLPEPRDYGQTLRQLIRSPNLCSRRALHERFDHYLGARTALPPHARAAAIRLFESSETLAFVSCGNPRFAVLDPYVGSCIAVCEGIRKLVATGAEPIALVAMPSFGRAEDPALTVQVPQALTGFRDAAQAFAIPCVALRAGLARPDGSGPAALTPSVAVVGRVVSGAPLTPWLKSAGDMIFLLGRSREEVSGSAFAASVHAYLEGNPPWVDFEAERQLRRVILTAAERHLLRSAHDLARGGLARALVSSACATPEGIAPLGARIRLEETMRADAFLFGESQARMLVSVSREHSAALRDLASDAELPLALIGEVVPGVLEFGELAALPLIDVQEEWEGGLAEALGPGVQS